MCGIRQDRCARRQVLCQHTPTHNTCHNTCRAVPLPATHAATHSNTYGAVRCELPELAHISMSRLSLSLCLSASISLRLSLCVCLSASVSLRLSLCVYLSASVSLRLSVNICICVCVLVNVCRGETDGAAWVAMCQIRVCLYIRMYVCI